VVTESERQAIVDQEHLRLLPVFYWVLGGFDIFVGLYGLIYVAMGVLFASVPFQSGSSRADAPPEFFAWFFVAMGVAFMLGFGVFATLKILAGLWIKRRTHRTACLVIAGITCLSMPFGTLVGVFTFIVLLRASVTALFGAPAAPAGPAPVAEAGTGD
jgi:hypothetical protein